ncbi:unnamed protein product [Schistosoma rodhaini]|uniref:Clathrin light chain n=1 Tax=Schistosoma mansoni TaxID=6183 RepID=G4VKR5_SCHMA|nr:putative clathrin light chain [Schistosoma mansoni]CAH8630150.1 unnamed protein product [Schistosoma rodhaini]|eukprot:XP_018653309.1 putative clathrin light chain [Schistosoma mansoni]
MSEFDPVSDFLAREQEALGDLGDDFKLNEDTSTFSLNNLDTEVRSGEPVSDASYVFLNGQSTMNDSHFGHNLTEPDCRANNSVHDFDTIVSSDSNVGGTESWREEFEKRIKAKDAEEEKKCAELMETGKKELNDWYKNYHQKLETRSRELREKKHDSNGHCMNGDGSKPSVKDTVVWEKICNLCDFQSKQKTAIDTSRMRGILLSLKPNN